MVDNLMIRFAVGAGGLDNRVYLTGAPNQLFVIGLSSTWRGEESQARPGPARPDNSKVLWLFFSLSASASFVHLLTFIKPFYDLLHVAYYQGLGCSVSCP